MKTKIKLNQMLAANLSLAVLLVTQIGCERSDSKKAEGIGAQNKIQSAPDPLRIVLAPLGGDTALDKKIAQAQAQVPAATDRFMALEKLGWLFIAKARVSFDPGFYKLAEQCGLAMSSLRLHSPEALLLRGHVLQNLHHFKEAEPLARELVARRGLAFDYGLLGDVLMEQGRLDEAVTAYQQMADIRPDLHAYTRAAHIRWLKGDLEGAMEMMQRAVQAASPRDAESAAWVYSRMALYQLQAGDFAQSLRYSDAALQFQSNYPPALLMRGKVFLAQGKNSDAVSALRIAEGANPLPEYQWALAEALRAANREAEAVQVEGLLKEHGAAADPRTFALYLASSGGDAANAVRLSTAELETRADIYTYDALSWSLAAAGRWSEANTNTQRALAEGTQDARLFFHAGIIAAKMAHTSEAEKFLRQATGIEQMLLPSERAQLLNCASLLGINISTPADGVKKFVRTTSVAQGRETTDETKPN
jgi:tetratricopeptide (TPR) repeat protein